MDLGVVVVVRVVVTVRRVEVVDVVVEDLAFVADASRLVDTSAGFATGRTTAVPEGLTMHRLARLASTDGLERIMNSRRVETRVVIECRMVKWVGDC